MSVNTVTTASNYVSQVQPQPQTYAERTTEKKAESEAQAASVQAQAQPTQPLVPPQPTVNTSGQTVGAVINVKA